MICTLLVSESSLCLSLKHLWSALSYTSVSLPLLEQQQICILDNGFQVFTIAQYQLHWDIWGEEKNSSLVKEIQHSTQGTQNRYQSLL